MPRRRHLAAAAFLAATGAAGAATSLERELIGVFEMPVHVAHAPGDTERLFVVELGGRILISKDAVTLPVSFLDISALVSTAGEAGLLGLAFHPDHASNGSFYVHYTAPGSSEFALVSTVARYQVDAVDPDRADPDSAQIVLTIGQPSSNHNAGWIDFGPQDGYLYVAMGDGGFSGSGRQRAQDITDELLGKMLRIDVDGDDFPADPGRNYAIPPTNPFTGDAGDGEIWALGLRNPFRCGFDRETGDLWIGDVGESFWEEVNVQPADHPGGRNYGWGCMEGTSCSGGFCTCGDPSLVLPVHAYFHTDGCAIVGGRVYRGCAMPDLAGTYFFGDYCAGSVRSFRYEDGQVTELTDRTGDLGEISGIVAIGEDGDGELHVVSLDGAVWKIVPRPMVLGDLDGDGHVTFADLLALLEQWGPCPPPCPGDLNEDADVGFADLLVLLGNWG